MKGRRQVARHRVLVPTFVGSNPAAPAFYGKCTVKVQILVRPWIGET